MWSGVLRRDLERAIPHALVARVGADERLGPQGDRVFERVVGAQVDGARHPRAVQQELRRTRQLFQLAPGGAEKAESHHSTVTASSSES